MNTNSNYISTTRSDVVHQSVYDLIHSEDREEELQPQLLWSGKLLGLNFSDLG